MARTVDEAAKESRPQANMTPMIDVVFQLIIVFLCSMKFRTLDMKVEANLPRDAGVSPKWAAPDTRPRAPLRLRRAPGASATRLFLLDAAVGEAGEADWRRLAVRLAALHGRDPSTCGEIDADPDVPHGEVMRALDAFVAASFTDVRFRGAGRVTARPADR